MTGGPLGPSQLGVHNDTCDKIEFKTRKIARRAAKLLKDQHRRPFRCGNHWHIGRLSELVISGRRTADEVYPEVATPPW